MRRLLILIVFIFSVMSSFSQGKRMTTLEYIDKFKSSAIEEMLESKVPASITLAQGILESSSGNSRLARNGNNHFGIKCKKSWTGDVIYEDDDELHECFRAYSSALASYSDHSSFLRKNRRYAFLFDLNPRDYKGWARGLQKAGYATNKKYASMLIALIERYDLNQFDAVESVPDRQEKPIAAIEVTEEPKLASKDSVSEVKEDVLVKTAKDFALYTISENTESSYLGVKDMAPMELSHTSDRVVKTELTVLVKPALKLKIVKEELYRHKVRKGESLYSIAMLYDCSPTQLKLRNDLDSDNLQIGQYIYYDKLDNYEDALLRTENVEVEEAIKSVGSVFGKEHVVSKGETLFSIARANKVEVEDIVDWNDLSSKAVSVGQVLRIQE